jgi:hypothetical protein
VTERALPMKSPIDANTEWLEADGLGGFASGTTSGVPTRRYHALSLAAVGRAWSRTACCPIAFRIAVISRPSTIRSTPRSGT